MFKVGQTVWCLIYGKGSVISCNKGTAYPVHVLFDEGDTVVDDYYTETGKIIESGNRSLFFSEPRIEAEENPPFEPVWLGKEVRVMYDGNTYYGIVCEEKENYIVLRERNWNHSFYKSLSKINEIYIED